METFLTELNIENMKKLITKLLFFIMNEITNSYSLPPEVIGRIYGKFTLKILKIISLRHFQLEYVAQNILKRIILRVRFFGDNSNGIFLKYLKKELMI